MWYFSLVKSEPLLDLHRRWRLRSADPAAYWGIYVFSPEDDDRVALAMGFHSLEEFLKHPCLFLLGRPGAGKTAEFQAHFTAGSRAGERIIAFEARHLDGAGAESIFAGQEWRDALDSNLPIRLVLDSVDEALLGRGTFMDGLLRQLKSAKAATEKKGLQLSIVLTCRLSEWDENIAENIAGLWTKSATECTYELAPLSSHAALKLAEAQKVLNKKAFMAAVQAGDMESYACWPRTLVWLAKEYAREGAISSTLTALHERRCSWQFEDNGRMERLHDKLKPEDIQRMGEAVEILATAAIATGKQRFVIGQTDGKELDVSALVGAMAKSFNQPTNGLAAMQQDFIRTLKFGNLFELAGEARVFQEQADAEFLAARRLARIPATQLARFFGKETANGWQVFQQLYATAAMAAVHSSDFRRWLLANDPLVLLRTDFAGLKNADKKTAVAAFLELIHAGKAPDAHDQPTHLQTLAHEDLAEQLRPWLHDRKRNMLAREVALKIAAACAGEGLRNELKDDIWELAAGEEADELYYLSVAIAAIGVDWSKERLMTIATGAGPSGQHWNSRGAALYALFDGKRTHLPKSEQAKLSEVVGHFDQNPTGVIGVYDGFILSSHEFLASDDPAEVCALLKALEQWRAPLDRFGKIYKLAIATLRAACSLLPNASVTAALADWWYWAIFSHNYQTPGQSTSCSLADIGLDDMKKRQRLLAAMLRHPLAGKLSERLEMQLPCENDDFEWLLTLLPSDGSLDEKVVARLIATRVYNRSRREKYLPAIQSAYSASAELRAALPVAPDGDIHAELVRMESEQERRSAKSLAEYKRRVDAQPKYDPEKAFADALDGCRKGDERWWQWLLESIAQLGQKNQEGSLWSVSTPLSLPHWNRIATDDVSVVSAAARAYLLKQPPTLPERKQSNLGMEATKLALTYLIETLRTDSELRAAFRSEWGEVVLRSLYPDRNPLPELLSVLMEINTPVTLACIREQLDFDWGENRYLIAEHLDPVWSRDVQSVFEEILSRTPIQPESYRTGITCIARHDREAAAALALRRSEEFAESPVSDSRRIAIGTALLAFPEHWQRIWPYVSGDEEGIQCLAWVASAFEHLGWRKQLFLEKEKHTDFITALYGYLLKHLPPEVHHQSPSPSGIDHCRDIERACYQALVAMGRSDLLRRAFVFAGIADRPWTARTIKQTERNTLAQQWEPWPLDHFAEWIATDGGARITDDDSLQSAVEASLQRFEEAWKTGKMPPHFLWDVKEKQPLREKALSDVLKTHLEQDLPKHIIPRNTELFISREPEFFTGEKTDLHIQTLLSNGSRATTIIEVKLCDYTTLEKNMETQLAERYLREKGFTHGIYFVGWFTCTTWPKKKRPFQNRGLTAARRLLESQANKLSVEGLRIRSVICCLSLHSSAK